MENWGQFLILKFGRRLALFSSSVALSSVLLVALLTIPFSVQEAAAAPEECHFTNAVDTDFFNIGNWACGPPGGPFLGSHVPGSGDIVIIDAGTVAELQVSPYTNTNVINVAGQLNIRNTVDSSGSMIVRSTGVLHVAGGGASLTISGGTFSGDPGSLVDAVGPVTVAGTFNSRGNVDVFDSFAVIGGTLNIFADTFSIQTAGGVLSANSGGVINTIKPGLLDNNDLVNKKIMVHIF